MNARTRFLFLSLWALALSSLSGCVINGGGSAVHDLTFKWTFAGYSAAQNPQVAKVLIAIPGQTLQNGGVYAPTTAGVDGITLTDFRNGTYSYTIQGLSLADALLFQAHGTVTVSGRDTLVTVDLASQGASGDVTFLWNFGGHAAWEVPSVSKVYITIPGQTLSNGGVYAPTNANVDGITLTNFVPGSYSFTIQGLTDNNVVLYEAAGTFGVNGPVTVNVGLQPKAGGPAYARVTWHFPQVGSVTSPNCGQANGITTVTISIDGAAPQTVNCTDGFNTSGVSITTTPGNHTIDLWGYDNNSFGYFAKRASLPTLYAGAEVAVDYTFDWAVGSLPMKWSFTTGGITYTCAQLGISQVRIDLIDSQNQYVYSQANGIMVPCSTNGVQGTTFPYLYGDTYKVSIQAMDSTSALYRTNATTWPSAIVTAGSFKQVDNTTVTYTVSH